MSKKELIKYLISNNISVPFIQIVIGMLIALLLSLFVYQIYRITYTGVMYSRDFNLAIIMLALITTFVIMVIGSNLALSLGLVGALSIIRFRTSVKNSKDAAFLFWAIGIGLSCGTGIYSIGIVASIVIAAALLFFTKVRALEEFSYLLIIRGIDIDTDSIEEILKKYAKRYHLKLANYSNSEVEVTYELLFKEKLYVGEMMSPLSEQFPECDVHVLSYCGELSGETL